MRGLTTHVLDAVKGGPALGEQGHGGEGAGRLVLEEDGAGREVGEDGLRHAVVQLLLQELQFEI